MPRKYSVTFKNVTISAAQDLVSVKGGAGKVCVVNRIWFGMNNTALQTAQGLRLNLKLATATITLGSGGNSATPQKYDNGDAAATFTARINDTTKAITSGAFRDIAPDGGHNYGAYVFNFGKDGPVFGPDQGAVFELLSTVSGSCDFSGGMDVTEIG